MTTAAKGRDFWEQHIKALRASGQTSVAYARRHELSVHALGWWRRKLDRLSASESTTAGTKASKFVALKLIEPMPSHSGAVTLWVSGEVRLQMNELPPAAWLVEVCRAMRGVH